MVACPEYLKVALCSSDVIPGANDLDARQLFNTTPMFSAFTTNLASANLANTPLGALKKDYERLGSLWNRCRYGPECAERDLIFDAVTRLNLHLQAQC